MKKFLILIIFLYLFFFPSQIQAQISCVPNRRACYADTLGFCNIHGNGLVPGTTYHCSTVFPEGGKCVTDMLPSGPYAHCESILSSSPETLPETPTDGDDSSSSIINIDALIKSIPGFKFAENSSLGNIVSTLLPYLYAIAGFGLLLYLIASGFSFLTSSGDPKKIEAAKARLTNAIIGFALVFGAFWLTQIVNYIFGLGVSLQ